MSDHDNRFESAAGSIASARTAVDARFGALLETCEAVRDFALDALRPWRGRPMEDGVDRPLALLFTRATTTHWAIIELLRMSFGDQAAMLARPLFEDMVDLHWMSVKPTKAINRLPAHGEYGDMLMTDALRAQPALLGDLTLPQYSRKRRRELEEMFKDAGTGWTGLAIDERVKAIRHLWTRDDDRKTLQFFRGVIQRANNETLHVSARALASLIRGEDDTNLQLRGGPAPENVASVAFAAFWTYSQCLRLIVRHFDFPDDDRTKVESLYADGFKAFHDHGLEDSTSPN